MSCSVVAAWLERTQALMDLLLVVGLVCEELGWFFLGKFDGLLGLGWCLEASLDGLLVYE